jgi:transposase, IS6 family
VEQYANNPIETDHGRLKARLRPMRGLNGIGQRGSSPPGTRSCRTFAAATTTSPPTSPTRHRLRIALDDLAITI